MIAPVSSFSLTISGEVYDADSILKLSSPTHPALQFCKVWLLGQSSFKLKTSGSTGAPKEIEIQRSQMEASANATIKALALDTGTSALLCIHTHYIGGKMMLVRGMIAGWKLTLVEPQANPLHVLTQHQVFDFTALVPLQLHSIISESLPHHLKLLNQMKAIIIGGGAVTSSLQAKLQQLQVPIYNTYGMTETVSHIALKCLNGVKKSPYYTTLPNIEVNQDERGCLTVNAAVTLNRTMITNDLIDLVSKTQFEWLGRIDHVINTGGVKIPLEQLELKIEHLFQQGAIKNQFVIVALPDERLGQRIVLVIEGETKVHQIDQQFLKSTLEKYECPKEIIYIPVFPTTASGKIDRLALKQEIQKN